MSFRFRIGYVLAVLAAAAFAPATAGDAQTTPPQTPLATIESAPHESRVPGVPVFAPSAAGGADRSGGA
jgi:hypothetical protein